MRKFTGILLVVLIAFTSTAPLADDKIIFSSYEIKSKMESMLEEFKGKSSQIQPLDTEFTEHMFGSLSQHLASNDPKHAGSTCTVATGLMSFDLLFHAYQAYSLLQVG